MNLFRGRMDDRTEEQKYQYRKMIAETKIIRLSGIYLEVVSSKVKRNKQSGQSEGYGFIEFVNRAAAKRHLQAYNSTLMPNVEQLFRLNWASFGAGERNQDDTPDYTIFVGDLAADVTDDLTGDELLYSV
ncbi:polyadenylate-binding protein RBP45-like [Helianthus annuus]|uniref:polyadenylate-binding protein RBP45-like n=1 Tax=Helianthus annuus TaxID=4232 RepID=UPI000B8F5424|nr:polyadenylate-binding protein RBP45-like [Helianthus annuus]